MLELAQESSRDSMRKWAMNASDLDFSNRMLSAARQRTANMQLDCSFVFGDAEDPPFPSDTFDVVSSRHLLFNLPRPGVAVREWMRVLKPGGKMILIGEDHNECHQHHRPSLTLSIKRIWDWCMMRFSQSRRPGWKASPDYLRAVSECPLFHHTQGSLHAVMEAAGLRDIRSCPTDEIHAARLRSCSLAKRLSIRVGRPFILIGVKPCPHRQLTTEHRFDKQFRMLEDWAGNHEQWCYHRTRLGRLCHEARAVHLRTGITIAEEAREGKSH